SEWILREAGEAERDESPADQTPATLADPDERERKPPRERGNEEGIRSHVARVREEERARQERGAGQASTDGAEQLRAEPGRRRDGRHSCGRRHRAGRALGRPEHRERARLQPVQERRLVDIDDPVERQPQRITGVQQLASDLGVHAFSGVVERRGAESKKAEDDGTERRGERNDRRASPRVYHRATVPVPPLALRIPRLDVVHGDHGEDDYFWLRDKDDPRVTAYLEAENAYTAAVMQPMQAFQDALYQEILGRIKEDDTTVPYRRGDYFYYSRTEKGNQYPIHCRR